MFSHASAHRYSGCRQQRVEAFALLNSL